MISTIYEQMLFERQRLEEQIKAIQGKISDFPDGKLICARNGSHIKWYQSNGHDQTYIPKGNQKLAQQLAAKKYLSLLAKDLLCEQRAIDYYLRHHTADTGRAQQFLTDTRYADLLIPFFSPSSKELLNWMNSPYEHNKKYPEQLIHKTSSGHFVRSKSEAMIAMLLHLNKIPFRYECALHLGDSTIYPDFTIRHPKTGQTLYWEHFGMMDDPGYCKNTCSKLQLYLTNGIIPSIHLITTYETKEHPLSSELAENTVSHYFLKE